MHTDQQTVTSPAIAIRDNLKQIIQENNALAEAISYADVEPLIDGIQQANAIFLIAAGRSGYSMRSTAMRLMHLGFNVHFVGDTTAPAIRERDLLWAASGSGTTSSIVRAAEKAKSVGAQVFAITTNASSKLADITDAHLLVPAAEKEDRGEGKSRQYAGSLFEQALLLIGDAIFMELWKSAGSSAETLWQRHANME